jgi:putative spermidine/putrescine transport system permease protein
MTSFTRERLVALGLLVPTSLLIAFTLVVPLALLLSNSFREFDPYLGAGGGLTLAHYAKVLADPFYWEVLWRTVRVSLIVTVACALAGYPIAYYIVYYSGRHRTVILVGLLAPLFISALVRTYGWVILLGQGGPVDSALASLGLIRGPLRLIGSESGVALGLAHLYLALMVLPIAAALRNVDPAVVRAAQVLGAPPLGAFLRVTLPLSVPGIMAGAVIVFSLSAGAFITPAIMGGQRVRVMSFSIWEQISVLHNYAFGSVLAVMLLGVVTIIVFLSFAFTGRRTAS